MKKNELIGITGMTGVGKDFLVDRANRPHDLPVYNLGTLIGQELAADRDLMMDVVPPAAMRAAQLSVYRQVVDLQPALVTCHAIRPQPNPDSPRLGYDAEMEGIFNPAAYVFVAAPPDIIAQRVRERNLRGERKSEELPVREIGRIQDQKLRAMEALAVDLSCELVVLDNIPEATEANVAQLSQVIGMFSPEPAAA